MSQITYRANLSAKSFPFISENFGRSVIVGQYDNNFNRQITSSEDIDADVGIPQAYYMHNVMPTSQGFQSVGYSTLVYGIVNGFSSIQILRDGNGNKAYLGITTSGDLYISLGTNWIFKVNHAPGIVTTAYVSGTTYIWIAGYGCIKYDFGTAAFVGVTLTGLSVPAILGITATAGYLFAWSFNAVAWSSTIDPTDFTPSLATGAGGGNVEGAKGAITVCKPHTQGVVIYTTSNAVVAIYSGNARYPFNFREIVASGGLASESLIGYDANSGNHYVYTTSGLQMVSTSQTQTIFPEVTDFISGRYLEDFDEVTNTLSTVTLTATLNKKVSVISDRYMVISYGITNLTHAIVYDIAQKRWGKLKIPHVDTFEFELINSNVLEIPKQSIGFLQADGTIKVVDFSVTSQVSNGVLILGKYQFVRQRMLQLDTVALENVRVPVGFSLSILPAIDGKDTAIEPSALLSKSDYQNVYGTRAIGTNISLLFKGPFSLTSLILQFNIHGKR